MCARTLLLGTFFSPMSSSRDYNFIRGHALYICIHLYLLPRQTKLRPLFHLLFFLLFRLPPSNWTVLPPQFQSPHRRETRPPQRAQQPQLPPPLQPETEVFQVEDKIQTLHLQLQIGMQQPLLSSYELPQMPSVRVTLQLPYDTIQKL